MVQNVSTIMIDDVTGEELVEGAGETVLFALDGINYELDVDTRTANKLRALLQRYATAGRRTPEAQRRRRRPVPSVAAQPSSEYGQPPMR